MVTAALDSWLLQVRRSQGLRRALRSALGHHAASRPLEGTPFRVAFPAGQHLSLFFARRVRYEAAVTRHVHALVPRGGVAFDVGANLGIYSLLFANAVGSTGEVYAFEPDPQNVPWLARNIHRNQLANVHLEPIALGAAAGEMTLHQDLATTRTTSLLADAWQPDSDARAQTRVRVERLDAWLPKVTRADFVKIDTEGFECEVLRGARELLAEFGPKILVEVQERNRSEIDALLRPLGYRVFDPTTLEPIADFRHGDLLFIRS